MGPLYILHMKSKYFCTQLAFSLWKMSHSPGASYGSGREHRRSNLLISFKVLESNRPLTAVAAPGRPFRYSITMAPPTRATSYLQRCSHSNQQHVASAMSLLDAMTLSRRRAFRQIHSAPTIHIGDGGADRSTPEGRRAFLVGLLEQALAINDLKLDSIASDVYGIAQEGDPEDSSI